jgi:hypothetical protein
LLAFERARHVKRVVYVTVGETCFADYKHFIEPAAVISAMGWDGGGVEEGGGIHFTHVKCCSGKPHSNKGEAINTNCLNIIET